VLLIFLAAAASLFLLTLPNMATESPVAIDHPLSFIVIFVVALAGFLLRLFAFVQQPEAFPFPPLRGPGFWLAGVGLLILAPWRLRDRGLAPRVVLASPKRDGV